MHSIFEITANKQTKKIGELKTGKLILTKLKKPVRRVLQF